MPGGTVRVENSPIEQRYSCWVEGVTWNRSRGCRVDVGGGGTVFTERILSCTRFARKNLRILFVTVVEKLRTSRLHRAWVEGEELVHGYALACDRRIYEMRKRSSFDPQVAA
ncbi:uncharacterized protein LOC125500001 [Athalia rosae]|uniref:uncharacterized protein LOC125500001 n=1 Tax=Athalia rosae TaxID=37344 RepID=UPI00203347F8|nr:uncharacterized protein LOC125500001 [Athalia rosae]